VYEDELSEIGKMWKEIVKSGSDKADPSRTWLVERSQHAMSFFSYSPSTPSPLVSQLMEHAFYSVHTAGTISLISSLGPLPSHKVRLPDPATAGFIKNVPVVPEDVVGNPMIAALKSRNLVSEIGLDDIRQELNGRALDIGEMTLCLKWWIGFARSQGYSSSASGDLLANAMISIPEAAPGDDGASKSGERIQSLGTFTTFLNPRLVPSNIPLPPETLPFNLSKTFSPNDLVSVFGWTELSITQWLQYIFSPALTAGSANAETNILTNAFFAERVRSYFLVVSVFLPS
jgi:hypothetical protein